METDLVSIIVPVYDAEQFLDRCIESALHQTYQNLEIVLVDDGSPDRCGDICDRHAKEDNRIVVIHQENAGPSAARNTGLDAAKGDFIYFLDSDDYIDLNTISVLVDTAKNEDADIVISGHYRVESSGEIRDDAAVWPEIHSTEEARLAVLRNKIPNFVCSKLFRSWIWNDLRFPVGVVMEDMYVIGKAMYIANKVVVRKNPLYYYSHENAGSITSISGTGYLKIRYGKYLAWREHEKLALLYARNMLKSVQLRLCMQRFVPII